MGLDVDIQATEKAKALLGKSRHKPKHVPSLPWMEVPNFYKSLSDGTITHLALRFLILTAGRSSEIRFCNISEIEGSNWVRPEERMKTGKEHRVPLSDEATYIIEQALPYSRDGFLFPSSRKGVISDATMARMMERRGMVARPHGFRSSFRTWCAETTNTPREVAEAALAHITGSSVERSYRRTDFLEQRRALMERWAGFVTEKDQALIKLVQTQ
jgi:integrase